ncbi:MAG: hypothetical protein V1708_04205 [Candidatus Micrarchaeota archaeon]
MVSVVSRMRLLPAVALLFLALAAFSIAIYAYPAPSARSTAKSA